MRGPHIVFTILTKGKPMKIQSRRQAEAAIQTRKCFLIIEGQHDTATLPITKQQALELLNRADKIGLEFDSSQPRRLFIETGIDTPN